MKKLTLAVAIAALPSAALASDPTPLYFFFMLQGFSWLWPFILPLFFLATARSKASLYFVLLLLPLGILELIDIPWSVYSNISGWNDYDYTSWLAHYAIGRHLVAIFASLLLMSRFRRLVLRGLEPGGSGPRGSAADDTAKQHSG